MAIRVDIFCKVVDNFGDAAVCWRLARQLANEHNAVVRLWLDQLQALAVLRPEFKQGLGSIFLDGVDIRHWTQRAEPDAYADVVIEGFGCGLPENLVQRMAERNPRPIWVVLEYLSAEPWVAGHHTLPSPHPRLNLERHYFFPGFTADTGGLLRESDLEPRRLAFHESGAANTALWRVLGCSPPEANETRVSLFGYDNPNARVILDAWANGSERIVALVPPGRLRDHVSGFFGARASADGDVFERGSLRVQNIAFLPQPRYDELLWACDWNFVRGEDSFVRAQWAGKPFIWQAYPQAEGTHLKKLGAFLDLYLQEMEQGAAQSLAAMFRAWNGGSQMMPAHWERLGRHRERLREHAGLWREKQAAMPELAAKLAFFYSERLKYRV